MGTLSHIWVPLLGGFTGTSVLDISIGAGWAGIPLATVL
jgi:hypothetical protein